MADGTRRPLRTVHACRDTCIGHMRNSPLCDIPERITSSSIGFQSEAFGFRLSVGFSPIVEFHLEALGVIWKLWVSVQAFGFSQSVEFHLETLSFIWRLWVSFGSFGFQFEALGFSWKHWVSDQALGFRSSAVFQIKRWVSVGGMIYLLLLPVQDGACAIFCHSATAEHAAVMRA